MRFKLFQVAAFVPASWPSPPVEALRRRWKPPRRPRTGSGCSRPEPAFPSDRASLTGACWTSTANFQIRELTKALAEFHRRGLTPVAVSVEKPDEEATTKAVYSIPFPILSDCDLALIEGFHVVNKVEGEQLEMLGRYGVDLEGRSGKKHQVIAGQPSTSAPPLNGLRGIEAACAQSLSP